jgi:fimbrial chaperone protein
MHAVRSLLALSLFACTSAHAGNFNVMPTRVHLDDARSSRLVTIRNDSDEPLRFEVTAEAWADSPDGKMLLEPTDDLVVFPSLLTIEPGEARRLRIGTKSAPGSQEVTYRVFVSELPDLVEGAPGIKVLTRMSLPVFVAPTKALRMGEVSSVQVDGTELAVEVANDGNVHFRVGQVQMVALDADGKQRFAASERGWYVLAGARRVFRMTLPEAICDTSDSIRLRVETERENWDSTVALGPEVCSR